MRAFFDFAKFFANSFAEFTALVAAAAALGVIVLIVGNAAAAASLLGCSCM